MAKVKKQLKIQASSISRILKCPASAHLELKLKDKHRYFAYKDAAEYGTLCHALAEARLKAGGCYDLAKEINVHPRRDEIIYTADFYTNEIKKQLKEFEGQTIKAAIEEKYRKTIKGVDCVAKCDFYILHKDGIRVFDLKSGRFDYSESASQQMIFAGRLFLEMNNMDGIVEAVTIQPNYYDESRRVVTNTLDAGFYSWLAGAIDLVLTGKKTYNCADHCKMCPSILSCPKIHEIIRGVFNMAKKADKETLNFAELYKTKPAIDAFYEANENYIKNQIEAGKVIPGIGLVETSGHRRWTDISVVKEKLAFLGNKIYEPLKLKSPAQLETIAGKENIAGLYETPRIRKIQIRENVFQGE